jgi:hypothetical protein
MALTSKQRFGAFFIGVGIGCVFLTLYYSVRGLPKVAGPPPPGVIRRQVPGVILQWMAPGQPIAGNFVLSEADSRDGGGASAGRFSRFVVIAGLDPGAFIRIEEISTLDAPNQVVDWKFMFADRVRAQLVPGADTHAMAEAMAKLDWRFAGGKDQDGWVAIALKTHDASSVSKALLQLQQWPQWVAKSAPDYLPPPAPSSSDGI